MQRLIQKHQELEQEMGLLQAQVEVCSWVWRWAQARGISSVGRWGGIQRAGAFKTSGACRLHSVVHPRRRLGASCSRGSPSTTYLPAPTLNPGFPTAPRAGGGPRLPEKPWDSPQPRPQAAGGDGQLAAALRRGPEAVGSPVPLSPRCPHRLSPCGLSVSPLPLDPGLP